MNNKTINYTITSSDVDPGKNYKPFSFMCDAQEAANIHATEIHFGYDDLIKKNCAWILSRIKVKYIKSPKWGDNVSLTTWHKGRNGAFYLRDFEVKDASDGTPLILSTSSWLILDLQNRKIMRANNILPDGCFSTAYSGDAIAEHCDKLIAPKDLKLSMEKEIRYSDIDFNGHANNAKYIEWAFDCINPELLFKSEIDEYQINFTHEARLGDIIKLYYADIDKNSLFIEGTIDNTIIFQTIIILKPKNYRGFTDI